MASSSEAVFARPAAPLTAFIDRYIGYRMSGFAPGVHRGLPTRHMTFIVAIDRPVQVIGQSSQQQPPDSYRCVLGGLQDKPALIAHDGNPEGVAIELTPLGSRALFGMPAGELWSTSVEFADLAGPLGR